MTTNTTDFVVFIDCLGEDDLSRTSFLTDTKQGRLEATPPRVTPRVMASIYTGKDPAHHGMMETQSAEGEEMTRPRAETLMEEAMNDGQDICVLNMPFALPMDAQQGSAVHVTSMGGQEQFDPPQMQPQLFVTGPANDLVEAPDHETQFNHAVDHATQLFANARSLAPRYDTVFIGFRSIDSYCHYQYETGPNGRGAEVGERYRDKLAEVVDIQLQQLAELGDVTWFSDHGATKKTDTFYINRWLKENGYLSYEIDMEFYENGIERGVFPNPTRGRGQNQLTISHSAVSVDREASVAVCEDAFDSCVTMLTDDEEARQQLLTDLEATGMFDGVYERGDLYDEEGEFYDTIPHIIPNRDEGVFVTGNVHPDAIGAGYHRTGVHNKWGCYGGTNVAQHGDKTPEQLYDVLHDAVMI